MNKPVTIVTAIMLTLVLVALFSVIAALPTMLLWNWLMPELFGLKTITFWQALGINVLTGILFKGSNRSSHE